MHTDFMVLPCLELPFGGGGVGEWVVLKATLVLAVVQI